MIAPTLNFNAELIQRYDTMAPRYTSYPTAAQFHAHFNQAQYIQAARATNEDPVPAPLSLYIHIPFCNTVCYYCACNKIVTRQQQRSVAYLANLEKDMRLQAALFDRDRGVEQLHWGGGTPTFLSIEQIQQLMQLTRRYFHLREDNQGDYSIEIDPRSVDAECIAALREVGFNRISMGVQDFDPTVQIAVNRIQPEAQTKEIITAIRKSGFRSLNLDLIYGLPLQNTTRFGRTLDAVIDIAPDRISIFNYAHLPTLFKPQRRIQREQLPSPREKLALLQLAVEKLTAAGYVYIGMDHFAKPRDELVLAQQNGTLHRNFQGYSTHSGCDLIGLGLSAISQVGSCYSQNTKRLEDYYQYCALGTLPVEKGINLSADDIMRRHIITQLICHFTLDIRAWERKYHLAFWHYFHETKIALQTLAEDDLLEFDHAHIRVKPMGRFLIRNICAQFDRYWSPQAHTQHFSQAI